MYKNIVTLSYILIFNSVGNPFYKFPQIWKYYTIVKNYKLFLYMYFFSITYYQQHYLGILRGRDRLNIIPISTFSLINLWDFGLSKYCKNLDISRYDLKRITKAFFFENKTYPIDATQLSHRLKMFEIIRKF